MSLRAGLGIAFSLHPELAGNLAALRALEEVPEPAVAVLVAAVELDPEKVLQGARSALGDVPVLGSTASSELTSLGQTEGTVAILLLAGDDVRFDVVAEPASEEGHAAGRALARKIDAAMESWERPYTGVIIATGHDDSGPLHLEGLKEGLPRGMPLTGGGSVGPTPTGINVGKAAHQFLGRRVASEEYGVLLIQALEPGAVSFGYGYASCWTPIAHPVTVTRSEGPIVYEVDDRPVLEYLEGYLGEGFRTALARTAFKYTFTARLADEHIERQVIRTPNWEVVPDAVRFFPREEMAGMRLQLVQVSRDELLEGTTKAATAALDALDGAPPRAVLIFSCTLRRRFLHSRGDEEVARVREVFGPGVPIIGFYAAGEYGTPYSRWEDVVDPARGLSGARQLSTSISILAIGAPGEEAGPESWEERLRGWVRSDHQREYEGDATAKRLERALELLDGAEAMIDETEGAFKHINLEHFTLAQALEEKNRDLARANRRSERLQAILRRYTPHTVWQKAGKTVDAGFFDIPDEELACTFMFLDVKGFTSYAENHTPEEVIRELNAIFEPATAIIYEHQGDIDKFIGDCIFATFDTAARAVDAAFEIHAVVRQRIEKGAPFAVRVGINTGRVVSGNVGGAVRRDNTLIGDAVNLAQRMESACTPGRVLLTRESYLEAREGLPPDVEVERREVSVKGKARPIQAYELLLEG